MYVHIYSIPYPRYTYIVHVLHRMCDIITTTGSEYTCICHSIIYYAHFTNITQFVIHTCVCVCISTCTCLHKHTYKHIQPTYMLHKNVTHNTYIHASSVSKVSTRCCSEFTDSLTHSLPVTRFTLSHSAV